MKNNLMGYIGFAVFVFCFMFQMAIGYLLVAHIMVDIWSMKTLELAVSWSATSVLLTAILFAAFYFNKRGDKDAS